MEDTCAGSVRFGIFEVDLDAGELRKRGLELRLKGIPFQVLAALLERPGELVSREELQKRIWPEGTYVDFDNSLNSAVNRLRATLGDSAENPRFVETLARRGYRFIAPVEPFGNGRHAGEARAEAPSAGGLRWSGGLLPAAALLLVALAVLVALRPAEAPPAPPKRSMLVVMPFKNLSADVDQEYFVDGLTEELTAQLARVAPGSLGVIAMTSAMAYKHNDKSVAEIAEELKVDYLVEGSVRRGDDRVRITAQLIRCADQSHFWAETYERPVSDVLAVQAEVARTVARQIETTFAPETPSRDRTIDPEALESYLRGRQEWNRRTPESLRQALVHFRDAIDLDPGYALAHAGLADTYVVLHSWMLMPSAEALPRAREEARRALDLDPELAQAEVVLAAVDLELDWNWTEAEHRYRHAIELNPNYATGRQWFAELLSMRGRHDEALAEIRRAGELDPLSLTIAAMRGFVLFYARRWPEADAVLTHVAEIDPGFFLPHLVLADTRLSLGHRDRAFAEIEKVLALPDLPPAVYACRAYFLASAGRRTEALQALADLEGRPPEYRSTYYEALAWALLGDRDRAFAELDRGLAERNKWSLHLAVDPRWDAFRDDPRFADLVERVESSGI